MAYVLELFKVMLGARVAAYWFRESPMLEEANNTKYYR